MYMTLFPIPTSYICIYKCCACDFNWISGNSIILLLFLSYMPVVAALTIPRHCIISWCRVQGIFCYSCAALSGVAHRLSCCEVVSLHLLESPTISLALFSDFGNYVFSLVMVGGMSRPNLVFLDSRGFCGQVWVGYFFDS